MSFGAEPSNPYAFRQEEPGSASVFNPAKRNAMELKYTLDRNPEMEITGEAAQRQTEENLARPDIGPLMKKYVGLIRELENMNPECDAKEKEYKKARTLVQLYDKTERRIKDGSLDAANNEEDARHAQWLASTSRNELNEAAKTARERSREAQTFSSDISSEMNRLKDEIEKVAVKNRITTTVKRGDRFFMVQRRTDGLVMPKHLPMEMIGNKYYRLFSTPEALMALDTKLATPVLKDMYEATPVAQTNDRRLLQDALARLGTDRDWTRNQFLVFLQGTFSHELEAEFRRAHQIILMDDTRRFALDLPMDEHRRSDAMLRLKRHPLQEQERVYLERKKFGLEIHDDLKETERKYNARIASQNRQNAQAGAKGGRGVRNRGRTNVSGPGNSNTQRQGGNQGQGNTQNQGGQKRPHPGNGGNNGGRGGNKTKKGPRTAPKVEVKDSK